MARPSAETSEPDTDGLAAADEDAHAEIAALLALDFLQRAQPHGHRQRLALGEHGLGGVGAGGPRLGHHVLQQVLIHAAHMADGPAGDKPGRAGRALLRLPHGGRLGAVDRENQGARRTVGRGLEGEGDVDARARRR